MGDGCWLPLSWINRVPESERVIWAHSPAYIEVAQSHRYERTPIHRWRPWLVSMCLHSRCRHIPRRWTSHRAAVAYKLIVSPHTSVVFRLYPLGTVSISNVAIGIADECVPVIPNHDDTKTFTDNSRCRTWSTVSLGIEVWRCKIGVSRIRD